MRTIIMPGIGGSGDQHWQTEWERGDPALRRFQPSSWDEPDFDDWSAALDRATGEGPVLLVAHSLSCLLAVRWAAAHQDRVAGLFLVAPPDPDGPSFPSVAAAFGERLGVRPGVPALLVTSDDDPFCSAERSTHFADAWGVSRISVGRRGHINSESNLGGWPEGLALLTAFRAGLEPNRDLADELDRIVAARDRDDMGPTIAALVEILAQHPDDPRVLYEVGGAYDTAGDEKTAIGFYERAMAEGLVGDVRRRCFVQYGSTLRNLGRFDDSLAVFARARQEFPGSPSLGTFESLTLHAAGRVDSALASLLRLLADHVDSDDLNRYKPALRGNADYLDSLEACPPDAWRADTTPGRT